MLSEGRLFAHERSAAVEAPLPAVLLPGRDSSTPFNLRNAQVELRSE